MKINMENVIQFVKGILFSIGIFLLYYIVCPNLFALIFRKFLTSQNFWAYNLAYFGIYLFTFLIILFIVRKDIFKQFNEFKKEPKKFLNKGFSYWGYGIVVMMLSNLIVSSLVGNIAVNEQVTRQTLMASPLYAIPAIVFFGPFLEEIVFRYCLKKAFCKKYIYAFSSAFIFGILHVFSAFDSFSIVSIMNHFKEFLFIIPYGSLGFFFAKAYFETKNIFSSILPHMLHNSFSIVLILITNYL